MREDLKRTTTAMANHAGQARMPLHAAAWYAVELAAVMLGRHDAALRASAQGIGTRASLLDWCDRCAATIAQECGQERANRFWDKVCAALRTREPILHSSDEEHYTRAAHMGA